MNFNIKKAAVTNKIAQSKHSNSLLDALLDLANVKATGNDFQRLIQLEKVIDLGAAEYTIKKLTLGQRDFIYKNNHYYCDQQSASFDSIVTQACTYLTKQGLVLPDLVVFDISLSEHPVALMVPLIPSTAAFIRITVSDVNDLFTVLVHELTHTSLLTGHLFIDEAWAYFFEADCQNKDLYHDINNEARSSLLSLRALLNYNVNDDPFFEKLIRNNGLIVHAFGALFIKTMIKLIGFDKTIFLSKELAKQPIKKYVAYLIEDYTEHSIEQIEQLMALNLTKNQVTINHAQLMDDFISSRQKEVEQTYKQILLSRSEINESSYEYRAIELTSALSVAIEKATCQTLSRIEFYWLTSQFERLEKVNDSNAWYFLARGLIYMLRSFVETQALDITLYFLEAEIDIDFALAHGQNEPFIIAQVAKLTYHKLSRQSKNIQPVIELYQQLGEFEGFSTVVTPILNKLKETQGVNYAS